jgi:CBS domain containing-hemolysin-like protein
MLVVSLSRPVRGFQGLADPVSEIQNEPTVTHMSLTGCNASPHTRFPLIGGDSADYRGIVYVPAVVDQIDELQQGEITFEDVAAPPMTLRADTLISDAVDQFQNEHQELTLVSAEGEENVVGLVTATDTLEAVMGEIEDPIDIKLRE